MRTENRSSVTRRPSSWPLVLVGLALPAAAVLGCAPTGLAEPRSQTVVVTRWSHGEHGRWVPSGTGWNWSWQPDYVPGLDVDGVCSTGALAGCTGVADVEGSDGCADNQYFENLRPLIEPEGGVDCAVTNEQLVLGAALIGLAIDVTHPPDGGETRVRVSTVDLSATETPLAAGRCALEGGFPATATILETADARVVPSRGVYTVLEARFDRLSVPLGARYGLQPIEDVVLRVSFDRAGEARFATLGGRVTIPTVIEVARLAGYEIDEATARAVAEPDLDPDETGACQRVSIGLDLVLAPVELVSP